MVTLRSVWRTAPDAVTVAVTGPGSDVAIPEIRGRRIMTAEDLATQEPADLVVLDAGVMLPEGWLEVLLAAAAGSPRVATVSALRADDDLQRARLDVADAADVVRAQALGLHPRLESPSGPCVLVRRAAIDLVGGDGMLNDARGWMTFTQRCAAAGLAHLLADELLVDGRMVTQRARGGGGWETSSEAVARVSSAARRALTGLSVVVDARVPRGRRDGTWVHVLELLAALGRAGGAEVTAIVGDDADADMRVRIGALPGVTPASMAQLRTAGAVADVVHRPFQVSAPADLAVLASVASRLVITHQDLISYHNSSYFPSPGAWAGYRDLTRHALAAADQVVCFSDHVRRDVLGEDLVEPERVTVVPIGVDHVVSGEREAPKAPSGADSLPALAPLLLCLGTDFRHKNRIFALRILDQLQRRHDWPGWLVLAGPSVTCGSSRAQEDELLRAAPRLAQRVLDLGPVTGSEKQWLLDRTRLVLYPTLEEGFGLIPFEAAEHGIPCLWAAGSALKEILPEEAAAIVPWDASASADRAWALLEDERARTTAIEAVTAAGATLLWNETARRLIELYREVCRKPPSPVAALERAGGVMRGGISEDAMRLVGPGGSLPRDLERPLLALTMHPRVAGPVLGLIRTAYQASRRTRRGRGA